MAKPEIKSGDYSKVGHLHPANPVPSSQVLLTVPIELAGLRLDQVLSRLLQDYSRSRLQAWIADGAVRIGGAAVTAKQKMWGGEAIEVRPAAHPSELAYLAEDIAVDILYEDDAILVINKPAGLVVHPGSGNWEGTLLNALLHHAPQLKEVPRAGIVHRLDKDTSGLLVVAKTLVAQTALVRQLQARSVEREYVALAYGEFRQDGRVDSPIGRHPVQRTKMAVVDHGKTAVTHFFVEERFSCCTLLRCKLETGRTHQIRVHLASIHHPLVGDRTYLGSQPKCDAALREILHDFPRQALHAARLALQHPASGIRMEWTSPLPDDFKHMLEQIRAARTAPPQMNRAG